MQIIELDPNVWMRGASGGVLLHKDHDQRRQCCIGIACTAFGVADEVLEAQGTVADVTQDSGLAVVPEAFKAIAVIEVGEYSDIPYMTNDCLQPVYGINDDPDISDDAERVTLINAELERIGADFRFALKGAQS